MTQKIHLDITIDPDHPVLGILKGYKLGECRLILGRVFDALLDELGSGDSINQACAACLIGTALSDVTGGVENALEFFFSASASDVRQAKGLYALSQHLAVPAEAPVQAWNECQKYREVRSLDKDELCPACAMEPRPLDNDLPEPPKEI